MEEEFAEGAVKEIEHLHSTWIELEVAGDPNLLSLCAEDIELWPPDAPPAIGRAAVSALFEHGDSQIHSIVISNRRIRSSKEIAYLTASYKTVFSLPKGSLPRQSVGSHLWILEKRADAWLVVLVSWSAWGPSLYPESEAAFPAQIKPTR